MVPQLSGTVMVQSGSVSDSCSRNRSVAAVGGGSTHHTGSWKTCFIAGPESVLLARASWDDDTVWVQLNSLPCNLPNSKHEQ